MAYNHEDYDWYHPDEVVTIHTEGMATVAYGVRKPPVPAVAGDRPLPRPPHTDRRDGPCLGCEWVALNRKVQNRG